MRSATLLVQARSMVRAQPGEAGQLALMLGYSAAAFGGVLTVGFNGVAQALFLSRLPASDVPFVLILPAGAIVLTVLLYNRVAARIWLPHLAAGSSGLLLLVGLVFRLLLATRYGRSFPLLAATFLYSETAASVTILQFWTLAGQIFNPRQARRLFGLITAGGTLASVAAGLSLATLVRFIGVDNLILVVVGSLGACGVCAVVLGKHVPRSPAQPTPAQRPTASPDERSLFHDLAAIWRSPLLRAIAGLTVLASLLINIGFYQFSLALQITYAGHGEALAVFLGGFAIWTGLVALAMQLFVTSSVITRFGLFAAQLLFPLAMIFSGGLVLLAQGALWAMTLTRACDPAFRRTIHEASLNVLYLPVEPGLRQRAKAVLEALYALTFGLAGVVFLLVQLELRSWTYQLWSVPVLLLAGCWIVLLPWTRRQYVQAVAQSVNRRRLDFDALTLDVADETTMAVLAQVLHSADDRRIVHVLDLIAEAPGTEWAPQVAALLTHLSPQVRVMALRCLGRVGDPAYAEDLAGQLRAPEDEVRAAAVEALCSTLRADAAERVVSLLDGSGPRTVGAAIAGLLSYADAECALRAATHLKTILASDLPEMRREAARVLGMLKGKTLYPAVLSLLDDRESLHSEPLTGEGAATHGVLVAQLVRLLGDKVTRATTADALVHHGSDALPAIRAIFVDRRRDRAMRLQVPRILQRIGGPLAAQILVDQLPEQDELVRAAICGALAQLRMSGTIIPVSESALDLRIIAEISECYKLHVWHANFRESHEDALLSDALLERVDRAFDRIVSLLEVRYPGHGLAGTRRTLGRGDSGAGGMAAELLDSVLERRVRDLLIPLLEDPVAKVLAIAATHLRIPQYSVLECLQELVHSPDPWLRACAIFRIGTLHDPRLAPLVTPALKLDDALVREAALVACGQLLDPEQLNAVLIEQTTAEGFPAVRRYAQALLREMEAV